MFPEYFLGDEILSDAGTDYTKYLIIGGNGAVVGIRGDAPPEAKREYDKFIRKQNDPKEGL